MSRAVAIASLCLAALVAGCGDNIEPAPLPPAPPPSPTQGVDSAELAAVLIGHWDLAMELDPIGATFLGDHRYDRQLPVFARDPVLALRARRLALVGRAMEIDATALTRRDQLTLEVLIERLSAEAGLDVCDYERWATADYLAHLQSFDALGDWHAIRGPDDAAAFLARVRAMPAVIATIGDELTAGAAAGQVANAAVTGFLIQRLAERSSRMPPAWPLVASAQAATGLSSDARRQLTTDITAEIRLHVAPAYRALRETLLDRVLPAARTIEGLSGLPDGGPCYAAEIRRHTGLPRTPQELHDLGLVEVARVEAEMLAIGGALWGANSLVQIRTRLDGDPALRFRSRDEVLDTARDIIDRARDAVDGLFETFPATDIVVEAYAAGSGPSAASYIQPSTDGSIPARYFLTAEAGMPTWNLEATTYHEAIPGHHLQIARTVEMVDLPAMRRVFFDTAYVEGWGLYAERLAGEIGLYSSDPSRLGALSLEAFRACRLVVDTGVHALGWSRAQAEAYMEAHTLEGGGYVDSEVERYLRRPGQALAYKVGQLEILRLREEARAARGEAFSLRGFHEVVLDVGSVPLPVLDEVVSAWVAIGQ